MREKTKGFLSDLDELTPQRVITLMVILILICVIIYFAFKQIRSLIMKAKRVAEINELENAGEVASYTQSQYVSFADTLFAAMNGLGTDEDAIYNVFYKMKNKIDVLKLIDAYGVRNKAFMFGTGKNLSESLRDELSTSEMSKLNVILQTKGIDYTF
ncbi:MAG: annexin [Paludibacter sp.]|nr:annexin [Paludibacter sp.]